MFAGVGDFVPSSGYGWCNMVLVGLGGLFVGCLLRFDVVVWLDVFWDMLGFVVNGLLTCWGVV